MSPEETDREKRIEWEMRYCQHYSPNGVHTSCRAGCDIGKIMCVPIPGKKTLNWGPCIDGNQLPDALTLCPKWLPFTREQGEAHADHLTKSLNGLLIASPVISAWRAKEPFGKAEAIKCPVCGGVLHLAQSSYNGHIRACCETPDCINFIE